MNAPNRNTALEAFDVQVIGPVCIDINVDHAGKTTRAVGGAVICAAAAAASLGHSVQAVATVAAADRELLSHFPASVRQVVPVGSAHTASIRNEYATADQERRTSSAISYADAIGAADVPACSARIQHLAGLMVGDYAPELVRALSQRGDLAVDMQGFVRQRVPGSNLLRFADFQHNEDFYSRIRFLKVDTTEGEHLTGRTDRRDIARALHDQGADEIMVSNAREILILDDSGFHACPLRPRSLAGRTGRGDTVFSAYITERIEHDVDQSLLTACATVSLKLETPGPLVCDRGDVAAYLRRFYADLVGMTHHDGGDN